ncbi:Autonomous transposable element EN-1 mosaic protein, partial [Bienertia sinuspersici]
MDLKTIKENLTFPIKAPQYRVGVDGFMSYANSSLTHDGRLRCPCVKCVNNKLLNPDDVNYHLLQYGIMRNYSTWGFHGESVDQVSTSPSTEPMVEKETMTHMDMRQLRRFLHPKSLEKWILKSIGHKWRDYKCLLKGKDYDDDTDINTLYDNCPDDDVEYDQWVNLVNFWRSEEGQRRSNRSKESLEKAKVKPIHTTGTKSHARVREEMKKSSNKSPTRTQVYLKCHQHESEADITNQIKNVVTEQGDQELDLDDDPVSKVLGKDKYGRVRGLGLGVKPSDIGDPSYPQFCNGLNMSTDNEAAIIHYFRRLEGVVQKLRKRVKRQGITIRKVKRKLQDHDISLSDESESDADIVSSDSDLGEEHDNQ